SSRRWPESRRDETGAGAARSSFFDATISAKCTSSPWRRDGGRWLMSLGNALPLHGLRRLAIPWGLALGAVIACTDADRAETDRAQQSETEAASSQTAPSDAHGRHDRETCLDPSGPQLTGESAGLVRIGAAESGVRAECNVVADTALVLEGDVQPAILVEVGTDTVLAEIVQ